MSHKSRSTPKRLSLKSYVVSWSLDIDAKSPLHAARQVAAWMRKFTPEDDVFQVTDTATNVTTEIDLDKHAKQPRWNS